MRKIFTEKVNWDANNNALENLPEKQRILFVIELARTVLHFFEEKFPEDKRPRLAIEAAEKFENSNTITNAARAACDAAYDTTDAYKAYNAANTAWAAA